MLRLFGRHQSSLGSLNEQDQTGTPTSFFEQNHTSQVWKYPVSVPQAKIIHLKTDAIKSFKKKMHVENSFVLYTPIHSDQTMKLSLASQC